MAKNFQKSQHKGEETTMPKKQSKSMPKGMPPKGMHKMPGTKMPMKDSDMKKMMKDKPRKMKY